MTGAFQAEYYFDYGMTLEEWCNSKYNTDSWYAYEGGIDNFDYMSHEVDKNTIEYGISTTPDGEYEYSKYDEFSFAFKKLKNNTTYYIKTRANDIAKRGIVESKVSSIKTQALGLCEININPSEGWAPSKTATITGTTVSGTTLQ